MKTSDLIPIILHELATGDKYGYEIIKNIESKSENKIQIKQPALYTILKKLETSKFISSYWEDSAIGGKRHYYKITQNGLKQLETFPAYDILLNISVKNNANFNAKTGKKVDENALKTDSIDYKTAHQLNIENIEMVSDCEILPKELTAFTASPQNDIADQSYKNELKNIYIKSKSISKVDNEKIKVAEDKSKTQITAAESNSQPQPEPLQYVFEKVKSYDYVDFSTDKKSLLAKNINRSIIFKTITFTAILAIQIILLFTISRIVGYNKYFDILLFFASVVLLSYPCIKLYLYKNNRFKYLEQDFEYDFQKQLFIRLGIFAALLLIIVCLNAAKVTLIGTNMLHIKNFVNFYAPIILASNILIEHLVNYLYLKNYTDK